jgi:cytochrome c1
MAFRISADTPAEFDAYVKAMQSTAAINPMGQPAAAGAAGAATSTQGGTYKLAAGAEIKTGPLPAQPAVAPAPAVGDSSAAAPRPGQAKSTQAQPGVTGNVQLPQSKQAQAQASPGVGTKAPPTDTTGTTGGADAAVLAQGQKLFTTKGCVGCHSLTAIKAPAGMVGPNLAHVGSRKWIAAGTLENTDANLAHWIRNPQSIKEGVLMPNLGLSEQEAQQLVAYFRALAKQ